MNFFDNSKHEFTIKKDCPWYEAQQTYGAPNVNWCEESQCSIIDEPANTWSNLGFIVVALVLFIKFKNSLLSRFSIYVALVGVASGLFHATNNALTQAVDFFGMTLVSSFLMAFSFKRILSAKNHNWLFNILLLINCLVLLVFYFSNIALQLLFIVQYIVVISLEIYLRLKKNDVDNYKYLYLSLLFIFIAQVFAQIDLKRVYCNPENLFLHGHVIWHLLSSVSMLFFGVYINQILTKKRD